MVESGIGLAVLPRTAVQRAQRSGSFPTARSAGGSGPRSARLGHGSPDRARNVRHSAFVSFGTTQTFRNVRYSVAVGCKADIEQAASKMLDL
jgi:hypothetical protein